MAVFISNDLAGGIESLGTVEPLQLWAGEAPIITSQGTGGATLAKYTVVALNGAGKLVAVAPAASDGTEKAVGILAQPTVLDGPVPFFSGGYFNHAALVWPAAWDTLAERKAAFGHLATVKIGRVL